jgi:hypothetical protein
MVVIIGVCLFELVRRINVPSLRGINLIAQATFMIYLLHDNGLAYSIWQTQDWITLLFNDPTGFLIKLLLWTLSVFAIGLVAYGVFIVLCKLIKKCSWLFIRK